MSQSDVEGLGANDTSIHLSNGACGFLGGAVADKPETLAVDLVVAHDLARGDGAERSELCTELVVINAVLQILDVEIHALILVESLNLELFEM